MTAYYNEIDPKAASWLPWRLWDIGSGLLIYALRASGRRTSDNACGGWPTPQAETTTTLQFGKPSLALTAFGMLPDDISVEEAKTNGYRLNPKFSLWLMGYPLPWALFGERAMQSCRPSRRSS